MKKKGYDLKSVLKRMFLHLRKQDSTQSRRIAVYTLIAGVYPFMAVFLPKIAIGILEQGGAETGERLVFCMGMYFVAASILAVAVRYLETMITTKNMRVRMLYLSDMSKKLISMDYIYVEDAKFFEEYEKGINAGNSNANGIEGVYNKCSLLPAKMLTLVGMIILTGTLNPILLLSLIMHAFVIIQTSKMTHDYEYSKKQEIAKARRRIAYYQKTTQDFAYGKDIRIFQLRERIMKNYQDEIQAYLTLFSNIRNREYLLGFGALFTLFISNALTYGILIYEVLHGMSVSSFSMYVTMITTLTAYLVAFGEDIAFIWNEGEYVDDFYRFLDAPLVKEGDKTKEAVKNASGTLEIRFEHVSFCYPHAEKNVFTDLNFTIHAGERLAIVGVNGAGKSTLVKLMTGLFAPTEGHIYINDVDILELKKKELYELYSAVFQEVNVMAFSIRENVACAMTDIDESKVETALEKVGLWKKVQAFEKGINQMMLKVIDENGTDFSGGERQKLAIARGLYKDAPMVIMDEPTAALDALAEAEIYQNFSSLVEGKTAVYISHRLASTRFCDKIALFDEDGLKEYGTHEELMDKKGEYYNMFVVQGKYYQQEAAE